MQNEENNMMSNVPTDYSSNQVPKPKNISNNLYLIGIIIFLFLTSIYLASKLIRVQTQLDKIILPVPTDVVPSLSPSPVPTANPPVVTSKDEDNVFRSQKIGIEISFPDGWFVNDDYPRIYISKGKMTEEVMATLTHGSPGSFEIFVTDDKERISSYQGTRGPYVDYNGNEYTKLENIKIDGKDAIKMVQFAEADMASVGGYTTTVSFLNKGLLVTLTYPNQHNSSFDYKIYEEILSSLKFID